MKYKVGDRVRIKDTDIEGTIESIISIIREQFIVDIKCSKIPVWPEDIVLMKSVEEETKPNIIEEAKTYWDSIKDAWVCPEGYIFKDENGNVINATKIVLEKKKKKYPKTYEECINELDIHNTVATCAWEKEMKALQTLLVCRDAYWKLYGEDMGLGKPWEPTNGNGEKVYSIIRSCDTVKCNPIQDFANCYTFEFPTAEMRDAFYENFKELIENCKELL